MIDAKRTTLLTMLIFALHPLAFGAWIALIPEVKANLGLNKAELAIALLGLPVATVPSLQIASRVMPRFGPRRILRVMFPIQGAVLILPFMATSQATLFLALMMFGVAMAFMQVCLNVYAGRLEKQLGVIVMNRCHGAWALGLMFGSLLVVWLAFLDDGLRLILIGIMSGVAGAVVASLLPQLGSEAAQASPPRRSFKQVPKRLYLISFLTLAVALTEGAMADWGAVYMSERLPADSLYIGMGVTVFAGALALGRLCGDFVNMRTGPVVLARGSIICAIAGLLCLVLPLPLGFAFVGFGLVGLGASVGFPLGVSAAAALDDEYEGANIAIMSSISIGGFLVGPPAIGFLAEAFNLRVGLAALIPGLLAGIAIAGCLRPVNRPEKPIHSD